MNPAPTLMAVYSCREISLSIIWKAGDIPVFLRDSFVANGDSRSGIAEFFSSNLFETDDPGWKAPADQTVPHCMAVSLHACP